MLKYIITKKVIARVIPRLCVENSYGHFVSDQKTTHLFAIRESKKNQFVEHSSRPNNVHATHRWVVRRVPFKRLLANASCMLNWLSMTCIIRSKISYFISFYHPTNIGYLDHGKINLSKVVSVYTKTLAGRRMHMKSTLWVSTPVRAAAANESWWLQSFHFLPRTGVLFSPAFSGWKQNIYQGWKPETRQWKV